MCKEISSTSEEADVIVTSAMIKQQPQHQQPVANRVEVNKNSSAAASASVEQQQPEVTKVVRKCYQCKICSKVLAEFGAACVHITRNHYMQFDYQCPYCAYKQPSARLAVLKDHIVTVHSNQAQNVRIGIANQSAFFKIVEKTFPIKTPIGGSGMKQRPVTGA